MAKKILKKTAPKRKAAPRKVSKKALAGGRAPSGKSKASKVKKLIKLAKGGKQPKKKK